MASVKHVTKLCTADQTKCKLGGSERQKKLCLLKPLHKPAISDRMCRSVAMTICARNCNVQSICPMKTLHAKKRTTVKGASLHRCQHTCVCMSSCVSATPLNYRHCMTHVCTLLCCSECCCLIGTSGSNRIRLDTTLSSTDIKDCFRVTPASC